MASCLPFYLHPCSVHSASSSASFLRRRSVHDARSPLTSLRCGLRSQSLTSPSLRCRRYDPANAASASLRWPSLPAFAAWHPATGLSHAATSCRRRLAIYSGWRHRAEDCDDILSSPGSLRSGANRCYSPVNEKGHLAVASLAVVSLRCSGWLNHLRDLTH